MTAAGTVPDGGDDTAIAVIGMAGRFPGAPDVDALWSLLTDGREGLTRFTDAQLAAAGVPRSLRAHPRYVPVGGVIDGQDEFDPAPFGITDADAALIDPQQRLFLQSAWHALEDAGHGAGTDMGQVGVFAGAAPSSYLTRNLADRYDPNGAGPDPMGSLHVASGAVADYLPLQVAYRMDLTGPAIGVQTTCSTSLVAVHMAAQSLLMGECDAALAGGVSLIVPQGAGYLHVPDGIFAADGHTRSFGDGASGIVYTQGVGVVLLRRLADALADGDPIRAVVRGSAVNNDGAGKVGFTAPSPTGQARAIAEAQAAAGVTPREIQLLEAHGTGTALGDRIELAALHAVFGAAEAPWCGLGSVKSNIGHANAAAGIASLFKAVLAVQHAQQPASLHVATPGPELELDGGAFELLASGRRWPDGGGPRLAGVSSFGIGGTNCHMVLGQPPAPPTPAEDPRPQLIVASAATEDAAAAGAQRLAGALAGPGAPNPADAASTLHRGRRALPHRVAVVAADPREAADRLRAATPRHAPERAPRVVVGFPGAGAQHAGMGAGLYADEPVFARAVDECAAAFAPHLDRDIREIVTAGRSDPTAARLAADVRYGQPALFAVSLATARLLASTGVVPDALVGHSLGEYAAAVAAGGMELADAARLVAVRSLGVARSAPGAMLALPLGEDRAAELLARHPELDMAAVNGPATTVLSGPGSAVDALAAELAAQGVRARRLAVDVALHSRAVDPVADRLRDAAGGLVPGRLRTAVVSTLTGAAVTADELADAEHWARHLREPVRYADAVAAAVAPGPTVLVQAGPGTALAVLAGQAGPDGLAGTIGLLPGADDDTPDREALLDGLGRLWQRGVDVDADALHRPGRRRVRLPGYAFRARRLWIDPPPERAAPDPTGRVQLPVRRELPRLPAPGERLCGRSWWVLGPGADPTAEAIAAALRDAGAAVERHDAGAPPDGGDPDGVVWLIDGPETRGAEAGGPEPRPGAADTTRLARAHDGAAAMAGRWADRPGRPALLVVTRGAHPMDDRGGDPAAAAAAGIAMVLAEEAGLRWRGVDIPAPAGRGVDACPPDMAPLAAEAADLQGAGPDGVELALRGRRRWARGWVGDRPAGPSEEDGGGEGVDDAGGIGVAVVLGGLGRLGPVIAERLAGGHRARVVLASRRAGAVAEPVLHRLRARGLDVTAADVDVTDPDAVRRLLADAAGPSGRVDVIVHAAGAVGTDTVRPLGEGPARGTNTAAKVAGTAALHSALAGLPAPRVVLLLSSVAATLGGVGLAEYAAANRYLDAWAELRAADPAGDATRWLAVQWDTWGTGDPPVTGRAAPSTLPEPDALAALDALVGAALAGRTPPVVAVSPRDLSARPAPAGPAPDAGADGVAGPAAPDGTPAGADRGPDTPAQARVAALWAELFGHPVADAGADFFALGGHSLLATRMLATLSDETGVELRLRDLLAAPTVAGLAALLPAEPAPAAPGPGTPGTPVPVADRRPAADPHEPFPLTRVQHAYWVGRTGAFGLGEVACHFYLEYDCPELDLDRYELAWQGAIAAHPMLRAVVTEDGRNQVLPDVPAYRIRRHDMGELPDEQAQQRLAELRRTLSHRVPRPDAWPLFDVRAALLPGGHTRLFVGVDALICDTGSYFLLDAELRRRYDDPRSPQPVPASTFADHVAELERRRGGREHDRAVAYWRDRWDTLPGPPALPVRERAQARPWFGRRRGELEPDRWRALQAAAAEHGVTASAVLLTAYADLLAA